MKKILIGIFLFLSMQIYAQKEMMISGYWAAHYQLTSYGFGIQAKNNVVGNLFVANNIVLFSNNDYKPSKLVNLDANLQYVFTPKDYIYKSLISFYPLIGIGWANYKTEYSRDYYGEIQKDIETPVKGRYLFFNTGVGATQRCFENISVNIEYKLAFSHGRKHSTWLLGIGIAL